jgi:hypothetical protein
MPRPRYRITQDDVKIVHQWIRDRFRTLGWPEDWPELTAWDRFPLDNPTAKKLQPWCDRFLDAAQWQQVQAVIRAARRDRSQYRTVRLSRKAHVCDHGAYSGIQVPHPALFCCCAICFVVEKKLTKQEETAS